MVKYLRYSLCFFMLAVPVIAQNISVGASTDTSKYNIGDYIKYTIELRYDKEIKVELPPVKDSVKVLEFIKAMPVDSTTSGNKIIEKYGYIFSKYDSARVTIPSLKVYYTSVNDTTRKFLATNPVTILVTTLQVDTQLDIRDIKNPLKLPLNWLLIILIVIGAIALITGAIFGYRYYRKKKLAKGSILPEIVIPPHETALNELLELEEKKLWQQGKVKEYHSEITEIVRRYFEKRFNFRALEMTSAEILAVLSFIEEGKKIVALSDSFFSNADLVKFAKFQPMPDINNEMMKQAREIVTQTIPVLRVPETDSPSPILQEDPDAR